MCVSVMWLCPSLTHSPLEPFDFAGVEVILQWHALGPHPLQSVQYPVGGGASQKEGGGAHVKTQLRQ